MLVSERTAAAIVAVALLVLVALLVSGGPCTAP